MPDAYSLILDNALAMRLSPISVRELLYCEQALCDIYGLQNGTFQCLMKKSTEVNVATVRELINRGHLHLFVMGQEREIIRKNHQELLTKVSRSLSIGKPLENAKKLINLLTMNMGYLYEDPSDDELLALQYQTARGLVTYLCKNIGQHEHIYQEFLKQKHHFVYAQPFISSLFVLGILQQSHLFLKKDVELLFLTSYFKDIGMSAIPAEKYDKEQLDEREKGLLANHAAHSVEILRGRINLSPSNLLIIENHHLFSLLTNQLNMPMHHTHNIAFGFETMLISVMDIIAAMITGRPYRRASNLFDALDLVKVLISDQYPQEFKLIVAYFKNFFTQAK